LLSLSRFACPSKFVEVCGFLHTLANLAAKTDLSIPEDFNLKHNILSHAGKLLRLSGGSNISSVDYLITSQLCQAAMPQLDKNLRLLENNCRNAYAVCGYSGVKTWSEAETHLAKNLILQHI